MRVFEKLGKLPLSRSGDRSPRSPMSSTVYVTELNEGHTIQTVGINISRSGILVRYLESGWPGWSLKDRVKVKIGAEPRYFEEEIVALGRIVRLIEDKDGNDITTRIGIEFIE